MINIQAAGNSGARTVSNFEKSREIVVFKEQIMTISQDFSIVENKEITSV